MSDAQPAPAYRSDYASLVDTIHSLQEYRRAAVYGTTAYSRLAEQEKALREDLATTPEHQDAQRVWRSRVMAAKGRRVLAPKRNPRPTGVPSLVLATVFCPTDDGPRCA